MTRFSPLTFTEVTERCQKPSHFWVFQLFQTSSHPENVYVYRNASLQTASLVRSRTAEYHIRGGVNFRISDVENQSPIASWLQLCIRVHDEQSNVLLVNVYLVVDNSKLTVQGLHEITYSSIAYQLKTFQFLYMSTDHCPSML